MIERDYVAWPGEEGWLPDAPPGSPLSPSSRLRPLDLQELFALDIKPREMVLDPIIPEKGLVMIYAARGTGKTHVADAIAYAVATGGEFLRWKAPEARRVLLIDGEMCAADLRDRLTSIVSAADVKPGPTMFRVLAGDLVADGIGNLASPEVQQALDPWLMGIELLILDNLSSLTAVVRDNDAESWTPIQEWLLRLRRRGISVLIVHHAGKGGEQRGTSRREDVLDTSISLRRPTDYVASEGARFEVRIEKGRGIHGEAAKPFEARLEMREGRAVWSMKDVVDANLARVEALLEAGMAIRDIAEETGIKKSTVHKLKRRVEEEKGEGASEAAPLEG
jgi:putative DNA primase/helicase